MVDSDTQVLLEWLSGSFKNTFGVVPENWIQSFDRDDVDKTESYVVEWRKAPKPKSGIWHVYDARVHEVSTNKKFLEKKRKELEANNAKKKRAGAHPNSSPDGSVSELTDEDDTQTNEDGQQNRKTLDAKETEKEDAKEKEKEDAEQDKIEKAVPKKKKKNGLEEKDMVLIGKALFLTKGQRLAALAAPTGSSMTMLLVRSAFSAKKRSQCNYGGQKRPNQTPKTGLKKYQKMRDIHDYVTSRFPHFSQSQFSSAVNAVCGKKVVVKKPIEYVDTSSEEEEEDEEQT